MYLKMSFESWKSWQIFYVIKENIKYIFSENKIKTEKKEENLFRKRF